MHLWEMISVLSQAMPRPGCPGRGTGCNPFLPSPLSSPTLDGIIFWGAEGDARASSSCRALLTKQLLQVLNFYNNSALSSLWRLAGGIKAGEGVGGGGRVKEGGGGELGNPRGTSYHSISRTRILNPERSSPHS